MRWNDRRLPLSVRRAPARLLLPCILRILATVAVCAALDLLGGGAPLEAQPPASPAVQVIAADGAIVAAGFEPGEPVAWLGVARIGTGTITRVRTWREVSEADEDGLATLELDITLPLRSVWVAVGVNGGGAGVGVPPGRTVEPLDLGPGAFPQGAGGAFRQLTQNLESAEVLVVRPGREGDEGGGDGEAVSSTPGRGVWARRVWDGASHDADGAENASLALEVEDLEALPLPGPPEGDPAGVRPGPLVQLRGLDVIAVIDPDTLRVGLVERPGGGSGSP